MPERRCAEILLVEDSPDDVELTLHALTKARVANKVTVARDGAEALDYLFGTRGLAGTPRHPPRVQIAPPSSSRQQGAGELRLLGLARPPRPPAGHRRLRPDPDERARPRPGLRAAPPARAGQRQQPQDGPADRRPAPLQPPRPPGGGPEAGRHGRPRPSVPRRPRRRGAGRQVEIAVGELPPCWADPALLRQVWLNLLANALKFTRARDPARVEVGSSTQDGETVYFVRDNGVGFDMAYADKLFGVFQRLHRQEDYEGTGVGLALVQRILHRHGGRAWAEAEPGRVRHLLFHPREERHRCLNAAARRSCWWRTAPTMSS